MYQAAAPRPLRVAPSPLSLPISKILSHDIDGQHQFNGAGKEVEFGGDQQAAERPCRPHGPINPP
jgi:hypothetical protein